MASLQYLDTNSFKRALAAGEVPETGYGTDADFGARAGDARPVLRKHFVAEAVCDFGAPTDRILAFTVATNVIDRHGDRVEPEGFDLAAYRANPVVLFAHDARQPPIARTTDIRVEGNRLKARAQFMEASMDRFRGGFADSVYQMLRGGFLQATSVGFRPLAFERLPDEEGRLGEGIAFTKQDLLEFSIVPVPANPEALVEARGAGIDMRPYLDWVEEAVDSWAAWKGVCMVPKRFMETLLRETGSGRAYSTGGRRSDRFIVPAGVQDALRRANLAAVKTAPPNTQRATNIEKRGVDNDPDIEIDLALDRNPLAREIDINTAAAVLDELAAVLGG